MRFVLCADVFQVKACRQPRQAHQRSRAVLAERGVVRADVPGNGGRKIANVHALIGRGAKGIEQQGCGHGRFPLGLALRRQGRAMASIGAACPTGQGGLPQRAWRPEQVGRPGQHALTRESAKAKENGCCGGCTLGAVERARKKGYIFQCNPLFSSGVPKGI